MLGSPATCRIILSLLSLLPFGIAKVSAADSDESPAVDTLAATPAAAEEAAAALGDHAVPASAGQPSLAVPSRKHVIGAVARIFEPQSRLQFLARVDTGAASCSIHCEQWQIEDEAASMEENVGKRIRILVGNHNDDPEWIATRIESCATVKTSEREELRYKIPLTLRWRNFEKQVVVTLNNRSHMNYPLLLGRNFLEKDFVVDIDNSPEPAKQVPSEGLVQAR